MRISVASCAYQHTSDIEEDARADANVLTGLSNICIAQATVALEIDPGGFGDLQRACIANLLTGMSDTHRNIRRLLSEATDEPASVDALALARLQLEALYAICLMVQNPEYVNCYLPDGWSKQYIRFLLRREECKGLRRFEEYLGAVPASLTLLRNILGVTIEQQMTLERDQLAVQPPAGAADKKIPKFPTPGRVIGKITSPSRRRMLERLYPEYSHLCSFSHGSAPASFFKTIFNKRLPYRDLVGNLAAQDAFDKEVVSEAFMVSFLSMAQAAAELVELYPERIELSAAVMTAWNDLIKGSLLARAIWEIRTRRLLGAVA